MSRGSTFKKWDMHVHTPESYQHEYKLLKGEKDKYGDIWGKYVDELEKVKGITVLCPTDYFSIDGYIKLLKYREKGRLQNFELILPNIEFRLDTFVGDHRLNYHVIFSNDIPANVIEKEFINCLHVKIPKKGEKRSLCKETLVEIGAILKAQHKKFSTKNEYEIGCTQATVDLDEIVQVLKNAPSIFKGKYLLILAEPDWALLDWDKQDHLTRKTILLESDAIFTSNARTIQWALARSGEYESPNKFIDEFGSLKPCIHGSDAHCFADLCKPALDRYCWIKADATFDGLKQILYEPEDRISISKDDPESRKSIFTLDVVEIPECEVNDGLKIEMPRTEINHNLVAVIGGKGTGKTAMLDLVANCFEDRCTRGGKDKVDKNSFVQRIESDDPNLNTIIKFLGPGVENFEKRYSANEFFKETKITYIPQGRIEELSADRIELDKKIKEIIFKCKAIEETTLQESYEKVEKEINKCKEHLIERIDEICKLEQETTLNIVREQTDNKQKLEGTLKNKEAELIELLKGIEVDPIVRTE